MSALTMVLLSLLAAYLLGSVPFAMIASRLFALPDPRSYGSKNPGATNVLRSGNKKAAIVTLVGDMAKGWLAVYLADRYAPAYELADAFVGFVAIAVFLGHLFPVFLKFKGGKGVATAAGVLLALDPSLGLATLGTWLVVAFALRYSSLAALLAATCAPLYALLLWGADVRLLAVTVIAMTLIGKHWANLQRLLAGTEPKIGGSKAPGAHRKAAGKKA